MDTVSNRIKDLVSPEEWQTRVDLAAFYRIVSDLGLTDLIYNHISARVPGTTNEFLINPLGYHYSEMTASSLVKVDIDGNTVLPSPTGLGINPAGFVIHSAVHRARHDLACVAHTHSDAGVAVSSLKEGLMFINQNAMRFLGDVAYHDYEGPALNMEEQARLVADMGSCNALILRNHGLLVGGRNIGEAYLHLYSLERACRMQVDTLACGRDINRPSAASLKASEDIYVASRTTMKNYVPGVLEWAAAKRQLDRVTTAYAD